MAEVTDPQEQHSPAANLDAPASSAAAAASQTSTAPAESRGTKRQRPSQPAPDDDDDDDDKPGRERRKIDIKFIQDKSRRHITFSKRKAGIMKKVRRPTKRVDLDAATSTSSLIELSSSDRVQARENVKLTNN
jgi:pheromone receptor transcription factor